MLENHQIARIMIPAVEAGYSLFGYSKQTVWNYICEGIFPLPIYRVNGRPMVRAADVEKYVTGLLPEIPRKKKSKIGAPTMAERRKAQSKGITISELRGNANLQ